MFARPRLRRPAALALGLWAMAQLGCGGAQPPVSLPTARDFDAREPAVVHGGYRAELGGTPGLQQTGAQRAARGHPASLCRQAPFAGGSSPTLQPYDVAGRPGFRASIRQKGTQADAFGFVRGNQANTLSVLQTGPQLSEQWPDEVFSGLQLLD
ncbi:MAG: hypothetical protein OEZ06_07730 [Myxococcales bacterium]|nr:hypothetical protein [Myxococcales bacterium]